MNTELQERMFGQCKAVTKATSSQRPDHIITNILLRLQEEMKNNQSSLKAQEGDITKFANTLGSKRNTVFPKEWLNQTSRQYQAHLERISDFLVGGPGSWWREINGDIEFFDVVIPTSSLPQHQMFHYRSSTLSTIESYLMMKWEEYSFACYSHPHLHSRRITLLYRHDRRPSITRNMPAYVHPSVSYPPGYVHLSGSYPQAMCTSQGHTSQPTCISLGPTPQPVCTSPGSTPQPTWLPILQPICQAICPSHSPAPQETATTLDNGPFQSSQARHIAKVLPNNSEVKEFDKLRTEMKALKEKRKPLPSQLHGQYDAISCSLKFKLVQAYNENTHALHSWREDFKATHGHLPTSHNYPNAIRMASQTRELAQKILLHEWQLSITT